MFSVLVSCVGLLTFEGFALRLSPEGEVTSASPEKYKVAVMVSGTFARYIVKSSMDRMVAPTVAQGHTVDLFLGLNKGYQWSGSKLQHDPFFAGLDQSSANFSSGIKDKVTEAVEKAGGNLRSCLLFDEVKAALPGNKPGPFHAYGEGRNENWLKMFKVLDQLWDEVEVEEKHSGSKYTHVMIMMDDAYWYADFDLNNLLKKQGNAVAMDKSWVMAQGCFGGSSYTPRKGEVNDFVFFFSRPAARSFGKIYTGVVAECSTNCPREWHRSEAFFPDYAKRSKIPLMKVDVSDIPYQRAYLKESNNPQEADVCIRYACKPLHHSFARLDDSDEEEMDAEMGVGGRPKGCINAATPPSPGKGNTRKKKHKHFF